MRSDSERFDAVHCWPGSCIRTIRSARRHGVPSFREVPNAHTAATFADSVRASESTGVFLPRGASHRFDARRLRQEELEFTLSDFLLVPSEYVANSFTERGIDPERLLRHQYGYDPAQFHPRGRADSERPFTAVFVGRGEPAKGLHLALRSWLDSAATDNVRFLILGRLLPQYRRYLADMLDHPSVATLGFVPNVADVLREADVLVLPTYTEGSALVTYEAMACGVVPLVSTSAGAPVRDGIDGFLHDPEDVRALGRQLVQLSSDSNLLHRMRQAAITASAGLTWESAAVRLLAAYAEGMARATAHPDQPPNEGDREIRREP
jgi:glycosyltransferase involved in cell wall biosynthesis